MTDHKDLSVISYLTKIKLVLAAVGYPTNCFKLCSYTFQFHIVLQGLGLMITLVAPVFNKTVSFVLCHKPRFTLSLIS